MATSSYTIHDDDHYVVIVGWEDALESFFARVYPRYFTDRTPALAVGEECREIVTLSRVSLAVAGYATLDRSNA
jgi:hypothetical protein